MTDYIPLIIGIGVTVLLGVINNISEKSNKRRLEQQQQPQRAPRHSASRPTPPPVPPGLRAPFAQTPTASVYEPRYDLEESTVGATPELAVEGARVTDAVPEPVEAPSEAAALKPPTLDELRKAVIWGEILRPKY